MVQGLHQGLAAADQIVESRDRLSQDLQLLASIRVQPCVSSKAGVVQRLLSVGQDLRNRVVTLLNQFHQMSA